MAEKRTIIKCQVAFIFLWVLASVNLAHAYANPPTRKVVDYNVEITESGEKYNETIEIDTESQTELFKVSAHKNVEQSNVMHDFKLKLTLTMLPERNLCYLTPLLKGVTPPTQLMRDLDDVQKSTTEDEIVQSNWTVDKMLTDRSILSPALAKFCEDYPIFYAKETQNSRPETRMQITAKKTRFRRYCRDKCRTVSFCFWTRRCSSYSCRRVHVTGYTRTCYTVCYGKRAVPCHGSMC